MHQSLFSLTLKPNNNASEQRDPEMFTKLSEHKAPRHKTRTKNEHVHIWSIYKELATAEPQSPPFKAV